MGVRRVAADGDGPLTAQGVASEDCSQPTRTGSKRDELFIAPIRALLSNPAADLWQGGGYAADAGGEMLSVWIEQQQEIIVRWKMIEEDVRWQHQPLVVPGKTDYKSTSGQRRRTLIDQSSRPKSYPPPGRLGSRRPDRTKLIQPARDRQRYPP